MYLFVEENDLHLETGVTNLFSVMALTVGDRVDSGVTALTAVTHGHGHGRKRRS